MAEFAKVETSATLTSVGAGLRGIAISPGAERIGVFLAGCVNRDPGEGKVELAATTVGPSDVFFLERTVDMDPVDAEPGDFSTTVFAIQLEVPVVGDGLYKVRVAIAEQEPKIIELWLKTFPQPGLTGE